MLAKKALSATAGAPKLYVEDVMSCFLYTGNGSTQTITNNIDLAGEGGLYWQKNRGSTQTHFLVDTARGNQSILDTSITNAASTGWSNYFSFLNNGFSFDTSGFNTSGNNYVSWTFRKAKKFFDVVTYTGNGTARTISHNLGSVPGCIIVKSSSANDDWKVYHRSLTSNAYYLRLNGTSAESNAVDLWNNTTPTSTVFSISASGNINTNGETYVAYLFAHDAGGFGDAGSDSIIKCGSTTTDGSGNSTVTLDWEPQFVMIKRSSGTGDWFIFDNMRKFTNVGSGGDSAAVWANLSSAEADGYNIRPTATGFTYGRDASSTYIYIAIRRGPMKTPTSGTSVFSPQAWTGNGTAGRTVTCGFSPDLFMGHLRGSANNNTIVLDKLRGFPTSATGSSYYLLGNATDAEANTTEYIYRNNMDGIGFGTTASGNNQFNGNTFTTVGWFFQRAPGFFDVVCYTGTGSNITINHNLTVVPEMIIAKNRTTAGNNWPATFNFTSTNSSYAFVNLTSAGGNDTYANVGVMTAQPTSTNLYLSSSGSMNTNGNNHVAYLFASCPGVSKIGTYTGNGSSVTVTTDFQPRFIMVKRTDSTGNWIVSDSARGLVSGSDPYLLLNSTAAEDTDEDWVDVSSTGFTVNETSAANANVNTGTYIYLAIA